MDGARPVNEINEMMKSQTSSQRIETRVQYPNEKNDRFVRWYLPQTGILSDAYVTLGLKIPQGSQNVYPLLAGILGSLETARLTALNSGNIICETDDVGRLMTIERLMKSVEWRNERSPSLNACLGDEFWCDNDKQVLLPAPNTPQLQNKYAIDGVKSCYLTYQDAQVSRPTDYANAVVQQRFRPQYNEDTQELSISLASLFPSFLEGLSLPLGHMEQLELSLSFAEDKEGVRAIGGPLPTALIGGGEVRQYAIFAITNGGAVPAAYAGIGAATYNDAQQRFTFAIDADLNTTGGDPNGKITSEGAAAGDWGLVIGQAFQIALGDGSVVNVGGSAGAKASAAVGVDANGRGYVEFDLSAAADNWTVSAAQATTTPTAGPPVVAPTIMVRDSSVLPDVVANNWDDETGALRSLSSAWKVGNLIDQDKLKFVCDLLYWDTIEGLPSISDAIAEKVATTGMDFLYSDMITVTTTIPQVAQPAIGTTAERTVSRLVAANNKVVRSLLIATASDNHPLLGDFNSATSQVKRTLQLKVNNEVHFVSPLDTDAQLYHQLSEVYGADMMVPKPAYSNECSVQISGANEFDYDAEQRQMSNKNIYDKTQASLVGHLSYAGVNLSKERKNIPNDGTLIGTAPIEVTLVDNVSNQFYKALQMVMYMKYEKRFTLINGMVQTSA